MELTIDKVFAQSQLDKRNLTNRINENTNNVNIALIKTSELYTAVKNNNASCLSVCEINTIIEKYVDDLDVYVGAVDQSTLGELAFQSTDPLIPPIIVDLCPHVAYCETDTVLSKVAGTLQISYVAEKHTDTIDLTDWFVSSNSIWYGTVTGRPNTTVQGIINEIVLAVDDTIDCTYFTGVGTPANTLALGDLSDVNVSGVPITHGDFIMFDGNNWVPTKSSATFDCSMLDACNISASGDSVLQTNLTLITEATDTYQYNRSILIGSPTMDDDGDSNHDKRMFFNKGNSAFRAGSVSSTQWDDANVGWGSVAFGANSTASGERSFTMGYSNTSSAISSTTLGSQNTASGDYSLSMGIYTQASGHASFALNGYTQATGQYSVAQGDSTTASGRATHSTGSKSDARLDYSFAQGGDGGFDGAIQYSRVVVFGDTTDASSSALLIGNDPTGHIVIEANTSWMFVISIVARQTGGTLGTIGDSGAYELKGLIKRDGANNTVIVGSVTNTTIAEDQAAWGVGAAADNTNEALKITVTGEVSKNITWTATVKLTEVAA